MNTRAPEGANKENFQYKIFHVKCLNPELERLQADAARQHDLRVPTATGKLSSASSTTTPLCTSITVWF